MSASDSPFVYWVSWSYSASGSSSTSCCPAPACFGTCFTSFTSSKLSSSSPMTCNTLIPPNFVSRVGHVRPKMFGPNFDFLFGITIPQVCLACVLSAEATDGVYFRVLSSLWGFRKWLTIVNFFLTPFPNHCFNLLDERPQLFEVRQILTNTKGREPTTDVQAFILSRAWAKLVRHKCSVSRGVRRKCATCMHTHYAKEQGLMVTSARHLGKMPFCLSHSLRSTLTGLGNPTGSRKKQLSCTKELVTSFPDVKLVLLFLVSNR